MAPASTATHAKGLSYSAIFKLNFCAVVLGQCIPPKTLLFMGGFVSVGITKRGASHHKEDPMAGRICRKCHQMVSTANASFDGTGTCPGCQGNKTTPPCEECKGDGHISLYLCKVCWLAEVGTGEECLATPREQRMKLRDIIGACPKRCGPCTVAVCLDDYMNARAFQDMGDTCYRCATGKNVRGDFASQP